jgi:hypothetical protein
MHVLVYLLGGHAIGHCLSRNTASTGGDTSGLTHDLYL